MLLAALALWPAAAIGQEAPATARGTAVVYTVQDLSGPGTTRDYEQAITDAVRAAFDADGSFRLVAPDVWQAGARSLSLSDRDLLGGAAASELARSLEADLAVSGTYTVTDTDGEQRIVVSLTCWDAGTGQLAGGIFKASRFDLGFYLLLRDWIRGLVPGLRISAPAAPAAGAAEKKPPAKALIAEVTFLSRDEGMEVLIAGDASAGVISGGRLTWPVGAIAEGTLLHITKRRQGYHESVQTIRAARQITLTPLVKASSFALKADWDIREMLGAGAALRWYPVPDQIYAALGAYGFVQPPVTASPRAVLHGDLSLGFGGYLFSPAEAMVRVSAETGGGVVLSGITVPGLPMYTDFYLSVVSVTLETRVLGIPVSLRIEPRYALGVGNHLVQPGWMDGPPLVILGVLFKW
jgi:hypothetical protein